MALQDTFMQLQDMGVFDVILPFILIFTLVFAILQKTKIWGTDSKAKTYNGVIALVMGLAVIIPHVLGYYPPDQDIVLIMNSALPNVSIVVVAILMALLIIGLLGRRFELGEGSLSGWVALLAFVLVIYIFGSAANWWHVPAWLDMLNNPDVMALVIVILVFAIIIWFITKDENKAKKEEETMGGRLGKMLRQP